MSIPSCILPHRDPYPLVTGPATGQPSCPLELAAGAAAPVAGALAAALGRGDACRERSTSSGEALRLGDEGGAILPHLRERARLRTLGGGERVVGGHHPVPSSPAAPPYGRRSAPPTERLHPVPPSSSRVSVELDPCVIERAGDALVLAPDAIQQLAGCRAGRRTRSSRARRRSYRAESDSYIMRSRFSSTASAAAYCRSKDGEACRLVGDLLLQAGEAHALGGERRFQGSQTRLLGSYRLLCGPHPGVQAAHLRRQQPFRSDRLARPAPQVADARVESRLLGSRIARGRAGQQEESLRARRSEPFAGPCGTDFAPTGRTPAPRRRRARAAPRPLHAAAARSRPGSPRR